MKWVLIIMLLLLTGCAKREITIIYTNTTNYIANDTITTDIVSNYTGKCTFNNWPYPDYTCSPGAIIPTATKEIICVSGYTKTVRNVPEQLKNEVYAEYGITTHEPYSFEIDHIISLELGGSNDKTNLWPESYTWTNGARIKDKAENNLHSKVCDGTITLQEAQYQIVHNWTAWT